MISACDCVKKLNILYYNKTVATTGVDSKWLIISPGLAQNTNSAVEPHQFITTVQCSQSAVLYLALLMLFQFIFSDSIAFGFQNNEKTNQLDFYSEAE